MKNIHWELKKLNMKSYLTYKAAIDVWFKNRHLRCNLGRAERIFPKPDPALRHLARNAHTRLFALFLAQQDHGFKLWRSDSFESKYKSWQILNCQPAGGFWTNPTPQKDRKGDAGKHCRHWTCPWCYLRLMYAYEKALATADLVDFPSQGPRTGWNLGSKLNALIFERPAVFEDLPKQVDAFYKSTAEMVRKTVTKEGDKLVVTPGAEFDRGVRFFSLVVTEKGGKDVDPKLLLRMTYLHTMPNEHLDRVVMDSREPGRLLRRLTSLSPRAALQIAQPYNVDVMRLSVGNIMRLTAATRNRRTTGGVTLPLKRVLGMPRTVPAVGVA